MAIMEFKQAFSMCTAGFFLMLVLMIEPTFQLLIKTKDADHTSDIPTKSDTSTIAEPRDDKNLCSDDDELIDDILLGVSAGGICFVILLVLGLLYCLHRFKLNINAALRGNQLNKVTEITPLMDRGSTSNEKQPKVDSASSKASEEGNLRIDDIIKGYAKQAPVGHCNKIQNLMSQSGLNQGKDRKTIKEVIEENEKFLFSTFNLIKDWVERSDMSDAKKIKTLEEALTTAKESAKTALEGLTLKSIKDDAKKDGIVNTAFNLLMIDIEPFAKELRVDINTLKKYKKTATDCKDKGTAWLIAKIIDG